MRNLVRRYVTVEQRKSDNQGVTEDDVNEIKQDISAFRCELIEVLKNSGMNTSTATGVGQGISFGSIRGKLSISSYYYFPWRRTSLRAFPFRRHFPCVCRQIACPFFATNTTKTLSKQLCKLRNKNCLFVFKEIMCNMRKKKILMNPFLKGKPTRCSITTHYSTDFLYGTKFTYN